MSTINGGFIAAGATSDYFPAVGLDVKLESKDKKALYEEHMMYGFQGGGFFEKFLTFPDSTNKFANMDALVKDPVQLRGALWKGLDKLTDQIVKDLSHDGIAAPANQIVKDSSAIVSQPAIESKPSVAAEVVQQ